MAVVQSGTFLANPLGWNALGGLFAGDVGICCYGVENDSYEGIAHTPELGICVVRVW